MINSVKIETTLQKRIFCVKKDPIQLLKITNFKGHYKLINSLVEVFEIHVQCCLILMTSIPTRYSKVYFVFS